jgi:predicted regulator of Ras-like GTPase activity (Roadblock/LC7/MglB family)
MSLFEEESDAIKEELSKLHAQVSARFTALLDLNGQIVHLLGESQGLDTTSLATLIAGSMAATGGLAKLLGENEFSIIFHEGERDNLHIALVAQRWILVVLFDRRSSIGLVRLKAKKSVEALVPLVVKAFGRSSEERRARRSSPLSDITEEDIDRLFT